MLQRKNSFSEISPSIFDKDTKLKVPIFKTMLMVETGDQIYDKIGFDEDSQAMEAVRECLFKRRKYMILR